MDFVEIVNQAFEFWIPVGIIVSSVAEFLKARGWAPWADGQTFVVINSVNAVIVFVFTLLIVTGNADSVQHWTQWLQVAWDVITRFLPVLIGAGVASYGTHRLAKVVQLDATSYKVRNLASKYDSKGRVLSPSDMS